MSLIVYANNASSLLASGIGSTDVSVTVTAGQGALFPSIAAGQMAVGTLQDTGGNLEIVHITARTVDTMVIVRGQEGTTAAAFASGSRFELRCTAGILATLFQKTGGDTISGTSSLTGILSMGSAGSLRGGELAGSALRGDPGETDNQILVPSGGGAPTAGGSTILTAANLVGNLPAGVGAVLTNMVLFWFGASSDIPAGYRLCDGTGGTPDLRDQFIIGGGGSLPASGGSASTTTGATSAGSFAIDPHVLTVAEIPAHHHVSATVTGSGDDNSQAPITFIEGSNVQSLGTVTLADFTTGDAGGGLGHTHTATAAGTHTHTYALPPYRALFAIMKT